MPRASRVFAMSAIAVATALNPLAASAQELPGLVVRVISGDHVVFRAPTQEMTVELADVVAPSQRGPLIEASRSRLAQLCLGKAATLRQTGTATDGAVVGHLSCAGKDAALEQVRMGMARVRAKLLAEDTLMHEALSEAKSARRGVWAD